MTLTDMKVTYRGCVNLHKTARRADMAGNNDVYYKTVDGLQAELNKLLREDFTLLSKPELLRFLAMCSTYRPMEPHAVLTRVSMQFDRLYSVNGYNGGLK